MEIRAINSIGLNLSEHHSDCIISAKERLKAFYLKILNIRSSRKLKATVNIKAKNTKSWQDKTVTLFQVS